MSFQPFAVQCLTCGSRLRVTDPAIVGTIASCPKCNSMVQIERPTDQVAVGRSGVDSQAITEEAIDSDDENAAVDPATTASGFTGSDDVAQPEAPSVVPPDWQSERTRRTRQIALVVAVSLSGLLAAGAAFSLFVRSWRQRAADDVAQVVEEESQSDQSAAEPAVDANEDDEPTADEPEDDPVDPETDVQPEVTSTSEDPVEPTTAEVPAPEVTPDIPADLLPQSPVIAPFASTEPDEETPGDNQIAGMQELPPELQQYMQFLPEAGSTLEPTLQAPPTMDDVQIEAAAEEGDRPVVPLKPKTLNLKGDLAFELALASDGYSAADLIMLVSQITGVPIQTDLVSFDLAGIAITKQVVAKKGWQEARALLDQLALELEAEWRAEESLVVFSVTDERFEQAFANITNLDDFGADRDSATAVLAEFLRRDGEAANPKQVNFGQTRQEKQLAGFAVEALRRMRDVQPKVADERLQRWAGSMESDAIEWPLLDGGDAGPQLDSPIALAGFLRRTARRNQATCLVNWYDAQRRGTSPEQLVLPHVWLDAASTMKESLSPFGMQVRRVDASYWWIGTEATYDRLPVVVWTPVLGESRGPFTQRIASIMAGTNRDIFRMAIDEQSDRALMLLPRYIVRQLPKIAPAIAAK